MGAQWNFSGGSDGKESACNVGDPGSIPGLGRYPEEGNGYPLQYCCLENSMDRGAWRLQSLGHQESDMTERLTHHTHTHTQSVISRVFEEGSRRIRVREGCEDATVLALRIQERTVSQEMWATSRSWRDKQMGPLLELLPKLNVIKLLSIEKTPGPDELTP